MSTLWHKLYGFIVLVKPRQTLLLLLTLYAAYFAGGGVTELSMILLLGFSGFLTIAGTTAMNMLLDRDIDSIMERTRSRPSVTGLIPPPIIALYSTGLFTIGLLIAHMVGKLYALAALLGFFFDIIVYTNIVKRSSPLNIILGGLAGAMPALGGWIAARNAIEPGGVLMAGMVMAWIPMHIWFIASYYLDDYATAGVPMAPVVVGVKKAGRWTQISVATMVLLMWLFVVLEGYGVFAAIAVTIMGLKALIAMEKFRHKSSREDAKKIFKFANPLLAIGFILLALEGALLK